MNEVIPIETNRFYDVVKASPVVVVDFYADWCGPCRLVAPIMEKLAREYDGRVKFTKLDVDANPAIANQFGIMSIPTLIVFKNGKPLERFVGAAPADLYRSIIQKAL